MGSKEENAFVADIMRIQPLLEPRGWNQLGRRFLKGQELKA